MHACAHANIFPHFTFLTFDALLINPTHDFSCQKKVVAAEKSMWENHRIKKAPHDAYKSTTIDIEQFAGFSLKYLAEFLSKMCII
jgi:hypothetical protein